MSSGKSSRTHLIARSCALCCIVLSAATQAAVVTPIAAEITYVASVGDLSASNSKRLEDSVGFLSEGYTLTNDGMNIMVNNAVSFSSAARGTLAQDYDNMDLNANGFRDPFTGRVTFTYEFALDEAADVSIRYVANGVSTSTSTVPSIKWWAMQGFDFEVRRNVGGPERFQLPFLSVEQISPISYDNTVVVPLAAGTHELYFSLVGNASGNQPGNRAMSGIFVFEIGDVPSSVPLPVPAFVLLSTLPWLLSARRITRATQGTS